MVGLGDGVPDGFGIAQVRLDGVDLADAAEGLEMTREFRPARRHEHPIAALRERAHHVAPEEARAAEHRDELLGRRTDRGDHDETSSPEWAADEMMSRTGWVCL